MSAKVEAFRDEAHDAAWPWPLALCATLAGPVLLSLAFPKTNVGILAFIALVPLFLLWARASWKHAFLWGWLAGTITFVILFHWMTNSIGDFIGAWSTVALVLLSAVEGLSLAAVAALTSLCCRGEFRTMAVFAAPAAWLLVESLRTRGSLGVPFGELGLVAAHLPWLLPVAAFAGVYGLTALIALANGAIAGIVAGTPRARLAGGIVLASLALLVMFSDLARARVTIPTPRLRVAIAQGNISQREKWTPAIFEYTVATYESLTRAAHARGAKVVLWPETVVTAYPMQEPVLLHRLEALAAATHVWILAGTVDRPTPQGLYNAVLDLTPQGSVGGIYHKRFLVPFAEYVPFGELLRDVPLVDNASHFVSGPGPHLLPAAGFSWGTLICYESAFAPYARQTANAGADIIIVATDDAWFGTTNGPYQHADVAVIDAMSTGRWVVRGADTGISEIIDPKGTIVSELPLNQKGIVFGNVGTGLVTPYDKGGVAWLLGLALVTLVAGLLGTRRLQQTMEWRSKRGPR